MKDRVFVVSHTHWDREWYLTKSQFQMMNVDMMRQLLSILTEHPEFPSFMLDGQLIALEDYLSVCPDEKMRVEELVRKGRLAIGPWYVLPDEYLASGEAHIRNYMEGMRVARAHGGGMRLGYLPDSFGHPSQMPQIMRGLGMEEMIFWRGPGPEVRHAEFDWVGKDGSTILALNMVYGYSNAANLKEDGQIRERRLTHEIDKLKQLSQLRLVLLMNGSDHIAPDSRVAGWVKAYQAEHPELEITHGTLMEYVDEAKRRRMHTTLQQVSGELRSGYRAYLLGDTLSTRMPIKQAQRRVEGMLEQRLEPMFALLALTGKCPYPNEKLRYLWKLALENLPHDSICGCSTDPVHREMFLRYDQINEIGAHLFDAARQSLAHSAEGGADGEIAVFSCGLRDEVRQVMVRLERVLHPLRYVDYEQDQKLLEFEGEDDCQRPTGIELWGADGQKILGRVLDTAIEDTVETNLMTQPTMNRVLRADCAFTAKLPAMSESRFAYRFTYDEAPESAALENEFYAVSAAPDGTLCVVDKHSGRSHAGLARLIDMADVGDEYTFDALPGDAPVGMEPGSVRTEIRRGRLVIQGVMNLPASCAEDRKSRSKDTVACPVTIEAELPRGLARVDVRVTIDNRAKDHRLMALFPLGARAGRCLSDSIFSVEHREIVRGADESAYRGWMEKPNNSFFQKNFADLSAEWGGLSVFVKGLPQFEVQAGEEDQLRLTLLRCVGWLSRKDLTSRDGNGGWTVETPEAQMPGVHRFEFAIHTHAGDAPHELYNQAVGYVTEPVALQTSRHGAGELSAPQSLIQVDDPRVCLSAFKAAEDGRGYILRLVNMSDDAVSAPIRFSRPFQVSLTDLAECSDECLAQGAVALGPWRIETLRLVD